MAIKFCSQFSYHCNANKVKCSANHLNQPLDLDLAQKWLYIRHAQQ